MILFRELGGSHGPHRKCIRDRSLSVVVQMNRTGLLVHIARSGQQGDTREVEKKRHIDQSVTEAIAAASGSFACNILRRIRRSSEVSDARNTEEWWPACERPAGEADDCRPLLDGRQRPGAIDTTAPPIIPWEAFAPAAGPEYTPAIQRSWRHRAVVGFIANCYFSAHERRSS